VEDLRVQSGGRGENTTLVETDGSRRRRKGTEKELSSTEQAEFEGTAGRKGEGGKA